MSITNSPPTGVDEAKKELEKFCQDKAKSIKDTLSSSGGSNRYNNYNKSNFNQKTYPFFNLSDIEVGKKLLCDKLYKKTKGQTNANIKNNINDVAQIELDFKNLHIKVENLLLTPVVSKTLDDLAGNADLSQWVQSGLELHKNDNDYRDTCSFCNNPIDENRIREIEDHFNERYEEFQSEIKALCKSIKSKVNSLKAIKDGKGFPHQSEFYEDIKEIYSSTKSELDKNMDSTIEWLGAIKKELDEKERRPFGSISLKAKLPMNRDLSIDNIAEKEEVENKSSKPLLIDLSVKKVNKVINKHNQKTSNFETEVKEAREKIEEHLVASSLEEYKEKKETLSSLSSEIDGLKEQKNRLLKETENLEKNIEDSLRPAEELNQDIKAYLGRDEIRFRTRGNGYEITRGDVPAENLSEGEKTAIAFLHFLKSLSDKNFDLENGIVVIDDPISSLDANSIYHAFGFMKENTKNSGQLFILTHNYTLFGQARNWFNYENRIQKKRAGFYMLESEFSNAGDRNSKIVPLDPLLKNYESEYHFLFSLVFMASKNSKPFDKAYPLPNVARRLLEAFLTFKSPGSPSLYQKMESIDFDTAKKNKILRFVDTYSHNSRIAGSEHDPSILQESPSIMSDILDLLESVDSSHFESMKHLVTST